MQPERVLKLLIDEYHRQESAIFEGNPIDGLYTLCYAVNHWLSQMFSTICEQTSKMPYREIAQVDPKSDTETLCVETAKFLVGEHCKNLGFENSLSCALQILGSLGTETADSLCVAVLQGLFDVPDEFGLLPDDWDAVESLRESYERFLWTHDPEIDVEAVIGEVDFKLHPSIVIHRAQGYTHMAHFYFELDRKTHKVAGNILAFSKEVSERPLK